MKRRARPRRWIDLLAFARSLQKAVDSPSGAVVPGVTAPELHRLAMDLYDIALGRDAAEVFEQNHGKRGNQSDYVLNWNRSLAYWHARATGKSLDEAVLIAQRRYERIDPPSRDAMIRIARRNRNLAFEVLEQANRMDLAPLKAELASRSRRGRS